MNKDRIIEELVTTRINGNNIVGNKTYESMLKRVTKEDILSYSMAYVSLGKLYGTKLEMIEQIRNNEIYR